MHKIIKLEKTLIENIIEESYYKRNNEITEEKQELVQEDQKKYEKIMSAIQNVPNCFVETRRNIRECVNKQVEMQKSINEEDKRNFYRMGFYDGIDLVIEKLKNK